MAIIESHNATIGIVAGAAWGTGVQATKKVQVQSFVVNDSKAKRNSQNHDRGYSPGKVKTGQRAVTASFNIDCAFGGEWLILYAHFAGTAAVGAEITGSQGDYLHTLDFSSTYTKFLSIGFETETDVVGELSSFKISGCTFTGSENGGLMLAVQGIADLTIVSGAATSNAQLNAIALEDTRAEATIFNGANTYFRLGDYSVSSSLDSADNAPVISFSLALARPLTPYYAIRGALTDKTYQPYQSGLTSGVLSVTLAHIDDSEHDLMARYIAGTMTMAEIFVDGEAIGTGSNRSIKIQIPYGTPLSVGGYGIGGQAVIQQPSATFELGTAPAAPSGMSGVTNIARVSAVTTRTTAYAA